MPLAACRWFGLLEHTNGRLESVSTVNQVIASTSYTYETSSDGIPGRLHTTTDSRTGTTTTAYLSTTADFVASVSDSATPARVTQYAYDSRGRQITTILPTTTRANVIHTAYTPRGEVEARWGSQTYPEFRTYDYAGRLLTLRTSPNMTGQDDSPVNSGGTVTFWQYSATTGLLTNKFHDYRTGNLTDGPTYTHTDAGRLETRLWKRGVLTTYGYDDGGRLKTTTYTNDPADTPNVTIELDALGRRKSVTNGIATSVFHYDPATLAIDTETVTYTLLGLDPFTRVIDHDALDLGRPTGWEIIDGEEETEHQVEYRFHATEGRLHQIESPAGTFTYGYEDDSYRLLATVTGPSHTVTNHWQDTRNVLDKKFNVDTVTQNTKLVSSFHYTVNDIGQRTAVASPAVPGSAAPPTFQVAWAWDYNATGELVEADDKTGSNNRAYQFDAIGNREKAIEGLFGGLAQAPVNYTANALNQYTVAAGVTMPTTPAPAPHDPDGNLRFDGGVNFTAGTGSEAEHQYFWDAENRLIEVAAITRGSESPFNISSTTSLVTYSYDSLSRRIRRTDEVAQATTRYLYDEWNVVAEYAGSSPVISRTYTWGTDLSGSFQGAGGVGGLLAVRIHTGEHVGHYFPTFDGNGNVSEYLATDGTVKAHYEYDPFGNNITPTADKGVNHDLFTYRFSTKPLDAATGLYYYGHRWYDPVTGRWPSRDPIEEEGGINLYGFVYNSPYSWLDILGREPICISCLTGEEVPLGAPLSSHGSNIHGTEKGRLSLGNWMELLPNCPCAITLASSAGCPVDNLGKDWSPLVRANIAHPGGTWETRWLHPEFGTDVPGQQCIYDACGLLITEGLGAGTPDYRAFDSSKSKFHWDNWGHTIADVIPYIVLAYTPPPDPDMYWKSLRPPNNGNNCPQNDGSRNPPEKSKCNR